MKLDFLYTLVSPPYCVSCTSFLETRQHLCTDCLREFPVLASAKLMVTDSIEMPVYAFTQYEGVIRQMICAKHYGKRSASVQLGDLTAMHAGCPWHAYDVIVPVPLHWTRYMRRGFNQAKVLAARISALRNVPVDTSVRRVLRTAYQARTGRIDRQANVRHAFEVPERLRAKLRGKRVLIVDDLMTTGATLREVARAIRVCRPAHIGAVVAARVV